MNPQSEIQRVLCVIEGGLSPTVVGGPYRSEADLTAGIIQAINTYPRLADPEGDTIHALYLGRGRPRMQDFAGGFMDQLRRLARGEAPDDPVWLIYAGAEVLAKDRRGPGVMTGSSKKCRRTKCSREGDVPAHPQVAVRWPDGGLTWSCIHGMAVLPSGRWKIHDATSLRKEPPRQSTRPRSPSRSLSRRGGPASIPAFTVACRERL